MYFLPSVIAITLPILITASTATLALAAPIVEIKVGSESLDDNYLCWGPIAAAARLKNLQSTDQQVIVKFEKATPTSGEVAFAGGAGTVGTPSITLPLTLPASGAWKPFFILGTKASTEDKDVTVFVTGTDSAVRLSDPQALMVRVRKNAQTLTNSERKRFLEAFVKAAAKNDQFAKYHQLHTTAGGAGQAHNQAFGPWHRVLLLNLERELQVEDRSVALPYWEFDKAADKLFSEDFIGKVDRNSSQPTLVRFSSTNPLSKWRLVDPGGLGIQITPLWREQNGDVDVSPEINKNFMGCPRCKEYRYALAGGGTEIWSAYHGQAHIFINGVVGNIDRSPADPLFFLLHANVDRAWAAWQRLNNRFKSTDENGYWPQAGSVGTFYPGNRVGEAMWPWNSANGGTVTLPSNPGPGTGLPGATPKVGDAIDYLGFLTPGTAQGFCYDNIPFGTGPVPAFWP